MDGSGRLVGGVAEIEEDGRCVYGIALGHREEATD